MQSLYLLRTACQWRLLPREFPPCGTVYHCFQAWQNSGVWIHLHRVHYEQARRHTGRAACPSVVITDGQSHKTTERGGARGFEVHKRVKGRERHILVDTFGLLVANRVKPADTSDRRPGAPDGNTSASGSRGSRSLSTKLRITAAEQPPPSALFKIFARRIIGLLALAAVH
jgi:transposase